MIATSAGAGLICSLLQLWLIAVFARVILSWFPIDSNSPFEPVRRALTAVTEPVLGPLRNIIPPLGGFDLSPIVALLGVQVLQQMICR